MSNGGLEGVVVAETELSRVDGDRGRLILRGHDVESLVGRVPFEGICHLLWEGSLPDETEVASVRRVLADARSRAFDCLPTLGAALATTDGMAALRSALSQLSSRTGAAAAPDAGDSLRERADLTGAIAVFATAWARRRAGRLPLPPDPALDHAADVLRMLEGARAHPKRVAALDGYLGTVAEHGMNASTFTARVVASTGADSLSAVVAALAALKGPLHGGAPGPVLDMLEAIGAPERALAWLECELDAGRRIMGMGHRVYRVRDPRAAILERSVEALERAGIGGRRLALARAVERAATQVLATRYPERRLAANVEFYTAVLLDAIGLPRDLFTPTFAMARVAGWLAHAAEQSRSGRIIRPRQRYVGPTPAAVAAGA